MAKNKFFLITVLFLLSLIQKAQTVFWSENFNNGCAANCLANGVSTGNGAWSVVSLAGDANPGIGDLPNQWYISCAENGHTNTVCGSGCLAGNAANTLASLHLSSTSVGDIGAAYDAGGLCGFLWCTNTHKRVQSPLISTIGYSGISIAMDYIEFGNNAADDLYSFAYSTNGGTSWTTIFNPAKTTCCGGACNGSLQGRWTNTTTVTLPVAANNIANFRIAFVWINNDDGIGADPSFAVDNIRIRYTSVLPVELIDFKADINNMNNVDLSWATAAEKNAAYFEIEKSTDAVSYATIGKVYPLRNKYETKQYSFSDNQALNQVTYYRLKMVDNDDSYEYSSVAVAEPMSHPGSMNVYVDEMQQIIIDKKIISKNNFDNLAIINSDGKIIKNYNSAELKAAHGQKIILPAADLVPGIYLIRLRGESTQSSFKILIAQ